MTAQVPNSRCPLACPLASSTGPLNAPMSGDIRRVGPMTVSASPSVLSSPSCVPPASLPNLPVRGACHVRGGRS
jgi:hypothetical protein